MKTINSRDFSIIPRDFSIKAPVGPEITANVFYHLEHAAPVNIKDMLKMEVDDIKASIKQAIQNDPNIPKMVAMASIIPAGIDLFMHPDEIKDHFVATSFAESGLRNVANSSGESTASGYNQMTDAAKQDAIEFLRSHPDYKRMLYAVSSDPNLYLPVVWNTVVLTRLAKNWKQVGASMVPKFPYEKGTLGAYIHKLIKDTGVPADVQRQMIMSGYHTQGLYSFGQKNITYPGRPVHDATIYSSIKTTK